jgi:cysteine desulfurase family protein (TIGR01976 family)
VPAPVRPPVHPAAASPEAMAESAGMPDDINALRAQFPALAREHRGRPVAYFDGPGGTQVPLPVVEAMSDYLWHHNANTHWHYPTSLETDAAIRDARGALAAFLNAGDAGEVSFGQNMTTITFHLARGLARGWQAGDEVVVTELDHHANVDPWRQAARDYGLVVRLVTLDRARCRLDLDALGGAIGSRTRLVAVGAASNAIGTITDVAAVAELARASGALVYVDAVHYAPHALVDVRAMGCDFLSCSAYKFHGPHTGVLWGRASLLETVDVPKLAPAPATAPERLETGTQNHEGMAGAAAAVRFLAGVGSDVSGTPLREALAQRFAAFHAHAARLTERLWEGLGAIDGVTLYGVPPGEPRTPTVAFTVDGLASDDVARRLADEALFVSSGDFYAATLVDRLGLATQGLVRVGCACYTTDDEVERLIDAVSAIAARR